MDEQMRRWHELFSYQDGVLVWKARPVSHFRNPLVSKRWNARFMGKQAGSLNHGYRDVFMDGKRVGVHRIVFEMHHGYSPEFVDHIDCDPSNNRINNLRACTHGQNMQNKGVAKNNTSGIKGVYWHKAANRWTVSVRVDGRLKHIGSFSSIEDAAAARKAAANTHYKEFANHG